MFNYKYIKMKSLGKGIISTVLFAVLTVTVSAQPGQGRGYGPCGGINQGNFHQSGIENTFSDLTEDQKAALAELRTEHFKKMKDFRNQMGEINAKQRTIMSDYQIDEKAAGKLIDQRTDLMNERMKTRIAHRAAVNQVLTEEQVLQLEQFRNHHQFAQKGNRPGGKGNFRGYHQRGNRGNFGPYCPQGRGSNL
jgi:Spy/CpxP family protein refolding chaperone